MVQPNASCESPEYRQFDFWVGTWDVRTPQGGFAGTNTITREHAGCVIVEHWTGAKGMTGTSLNFYIPATRRWQQTWVDSSGTVTELTGELRSGAMVLSGRAKGASDNVVSRITWTPAPDGSVRQLWEQSKDDGKSWVTAFDGRYRKKGP